MSRARLEPQTSQTPGTLTLTLTRPCPPGYVGLLRVICICWMFMLPFTLVDALGWVMIPVVSVTSFLVLCIEQLAVQIENPFGYDANDLPLHSFTCTVEARPLGHKSAPHPQRRGSPAPRPSRRLPGGSMHSRARPRRSDPPERPYGATVTPATLDSVCTSTTQSQLLHTQADILRLLAETAHPYRDFVAERGREHVAC